MTYEEEIAARRTEEANASPYYNGGFAPPVIPTNPAPGAQNFMGGGGQPLQGAVSQFNIGDPAIQSAIRQAWASPSYNDYNTVPGWTIARLYGNQQPAGFVPLSGSYPNITGQVGMMPNNGVLQPPHTSLGGGFTLNLGFGNPGENPNSGGGNSNSPWGIPQSGAPDVNTNNNTNNNTTNITNKTDNRRLDLGGLVPSQEMNFPHPADPNPVPTGQPNQFIPAVYNGPAPGEQPNSGYIMTGGQRGNGGMVPPPPPYQPASGPGGGGEVQDLGQFMQAFAGALQGAGDPSGGGGGGGFGMPPQQQGGGGYGGGPQYGGGGIGPQLMMPPQMAPPVPSYGGGPPVIMPPGGGRFEDAASYGAQYKPGQGALDALEGTPERPGLRQRADEAWKEVEQTPEEQLQQQARMAYPDNGRRPGMLQRAMGALTATNGQQMSEAIQPPSQEEQRRRYVEQHRASQEFMHTATRYQQAKDRAARLESTLATQENAYGRLVSADDQRKWSRGLKGAEKNSLARVAMAMPNTPEKEQWLDAWVAAGTFTPAEKNALRGQVVAMAQEQDLKIANQYVTYLGGFASARARELSTQIATRTAQSEVMIKGLEAYTKYVDLQKKQFDVNHQSQEFQASIDAKQAQTAAAMDVLQERQRENFRGLMNVRGGIQRMMEMTGNMNFPSVDEGVKQELASSYALTTRAMLNADPRAQTLWTAFTQKYAIEQMTAQTPQGQQIRGEIEATLQQAGMPYSVNDFFIAYEGYNPFFKQRKPAPTSGRKPQQGI